MRIAPGELHDDRATLDCIAWGFFHQKPCPARPERSMSRPAPPPAAPEPVARARRHAAEQRGRAAEAQAACALEQAGWRILGRRVRTPLGEIDLIAAKDGLLSFLEVKRRRTAAEAAFAVTDRQRLRIVAAAEAWLAAHPDTAPEGVRFDVLLVDDTGRVRRVADAFRVE
jgi:putative endonuclease